MKKTKLIAVLEPSETQRTRGAEVVFLRRDDDGNLLEILACTCHESWEQWGQPTDVLADNVDDVELWRLAPKLHPTDWVIYDKGNDHVLQDPYGRVLIFGNPDDSLYDIYGNEEAVRCTELPLHWQKRILEQLTTTNN